ncbi:riboflavin synthase [Pelagibaculum spongiae]|uniref:Riboflavin synthase n=1 Tax=Pelagibaculum spongiae TaxID=2080658 RepID=A0A2V1GZD8_9GAMM|nr:riboflavin synthase [Pelagibaculum spongiae]PVZ71533.1 riboflavin synthase [Pelagibaculum spongiae]
MFTGIVEAIGKIRAVTPKGEDFVVSVDSASLDLSDVQLGDSIAVNGVCLTATKLPSQGKGFEADVSGETLSLTTLGKLNSGDSVNLEKALTPTTRLGGHLVSGHVDGIGQLLKRYTSGRSERFLIRPPKSLAHYIARKGSITIDGVSLTVNKLIGDDFELNLVPHTLQRTTLQWLKAGDSINLEVDLLARYLERLLQRNTTTDDNDENGDTSAATGLSLEHLAKCGFLG